MVRLMWPSGIPASLHLDPCRPLDPSLPPRVTAVVSAASAHRRGTDTSVTTSTGRDLLTLGLFSRSACTSFWDPPRSRCSLSQRKQKCHNVATTHTSTFTLSHTGKEAKISAFPFHASSSLHGSRRRSTSTQREALLRSNPHI